MIQSQEKQRQAHLHAARLLLRQLRNCGGVWSDGRVGYRGVALDELRASTLNRIIDLKQRNPEKRRAPKMARMTKNFCMARAFLGQAEDETVADWLSRLLRDYSGTKDIGGLERSVVARRLLRKQFTKRARELATQHRYPDQEWAHVRKSRDRFNWALKQDVILEDGVNVSSGMAVIPNWTGFSVEVFGVLVPVAEKHVRKTGRFLT